MKSVGEIMSIGRSFEEIIQKGLRMIGQGMHGFVGNEGVEFDDLDYELSHPTDLRVFAIAEALEKGYAIDRIFELTKIDPWFLGKLKNIVDYKQKLSQYNKVARHPRRRAARSQSAWLLRLPDCPFRTESARQYGEGKPRRTCPS